MYVWIWTIFNSALFVESWWLLLFCCDFYAWFGHSSEKFVQLKETTLVWIMLVFFQQCCIQIIIILFDPGFKNINIPYMYNIMITLLFKSFSKQGWCQLDNGVRLKPMLATLRHTHQLKCRARYYVCWMALVATGCKFLWGMEDACACSNNCTKHISSSRSLCGSYVDFI